MLHDIGKLKVPDRILLKPQPLDLTNGDDRPFPPSGASRRWRAVRISPSTGEIARVASRELGRTGYPDGLYVTDPARRADRADHDAFDAMTNDRPTSRLVSFEAASRS